MRTFSGMLARLRQKALKFPCVDPEPSPCLSPALESLASQKRGVLCVAPSSEWDAKVRRWPFTDSQRRCVLHASVRLEDEVSGICLIVQGYLVKSVASHAGDVRTA